ncbi:hypothetical protein L3Q82_008651, partial [Scortum barcoo]
DFFGRESTMEMFALSVILASILIIPFALKTFSPYLWMDLLYFRDLVQILVRFVSRRRRRPLFFVLDRFLEQTAAHPDKPFIVFGDESYSYACTDTRSNKTANALRSRPGYRAGDTVALFMGNEPAFMFTWLALAKLGSPVALLNHNIRTKSLLHCFNCCGAKVLIAAAELKEAVEDVLPSLLEQGVTVLLMTKHCDTPGIESFSDKVDAASDAPLPRSLRAHITFKSPAVYIYTSGTTGLPKAAVVNQNRLLTALAVLSSNGVTASDVIYLNLPLYHTAGFIIGFIGSIETGSTIILKRKFSASQFWDDCRKNSVTVIQYIGEVMRYLCSTPKRENDKDHKVRLAIGNGIRAEIWREFLNRFGNIQMREFYASTEGNVGFVNYTGKIGAIGRVNFLHQRLFPYTLIQYDTERDEPIRDANGLCVKSPKGETGLLVSKITDIAPFVGYAQNEEQTERKRLRNVLKKGDLYFNSGDLMRIDKDNFIYFQDRVGDTFRWKGENVATTEVSDILTISDCLKEASVYGVQVPGHEGRIGMASVTVKEDSQFDGSKLYSHVVSYLPSYARPRFIRVQNAVEVTGTFKQMKGKLVEESFDPGRIQDPLYILDDHEKMRIHLITMLALLLYTALAGLAVLSLLLYWRNPYIWQDLTYAIAALHVGMRLNRFRRRKPIYSLLDCFLDQVARQPHKKFILFEESSFTYSQADRESNKAARALAAHAGLKEGDTAALYLGNEPHFVWLWLGLAKLGCVASLLNCNIRSKSLLHCFSCCDAKVLLAGADLREAVEEVLPTLKEQGIRVFILGEDCGVEGIESLSDKIQQASDEPLSPQLRANINMKSPALYIYTSGTTGLPKAAVINHERLWMVSFLQSIAGVRSNDIIYIYLPLYHSAGFMMGLCAAIEKGITVVLRRKFSTSQFWNDCRKYNVTVIQYIGEVMRYLCNTPKRDNDRDHKVRLALGNGIRAETWVDFLQRFGNIRICECYGATEGNGGFINYIGKVGAIGKEHFLHKMGYSYELIRYDTEKEEPVRDSRGFCIKVPRGETGLFVVKIGEKTPFSGYAKNRQQTEKKRLRDVFVKGDVYFNSGDLLRIDDEGFVFFQDRIGDTFRWKGENVATTEVADHLLMVDCIEEANVYGVKVPGHEGRIGMAALKLKENMDFDGKATYQHVKNFLPSYARPRFIRIQDALVVTGTFKQMKVKLAEEGFNPAVIKDPLFYLEDNKGYVSMTQEIFNSIAEERIRL